MSVIYQGKCLRLKQLKTKGLLECVLNTTDGKVNLIGESLLKELEVCIEKISQSKPQCQGLLISSEKEDFCLGADITSFSALFQLSVTELAQWLLATNQLLNKIEDFPFPTLACIHGRALGGGLELCLTADYRMMAQSARVALPEVKLGIMPGFGGTVRLPRLIGVDYAIEWIASGKEYAAEQALREGVVDTVLPEEALREAAIEVLQRAADGLLDYKKKRQIKIAPTALPMIEQTLAFETAKSFVRSKTKNKYPAPVEAIRAMQKTVSLDRMAALKKEGEIFAGLAQGPVANALISVFNSAQLLKHRHDKLSAELKQDDEIGAVVGAGIMGAGIAQLLAKRGLQVYIKDVQQAQLKKAMEHIHHEIDQSVKRKPTEDTSVRGRFYPVLSYHPFKDIQFAIEAVTEDQSLKLKVLQEIEDALPETAYLATNTSTLSITQLAMSLKRPEHFIGIHFFNPVNKMLLVEVIQGEKTSKEALAFALNLVKKIKKTALVVKDCPGFFINRVLFAYLFGFMLLLKDNVDYQHIDRVMKSFGWPMGPAELLDVIGIDTALSAYKVLSATYSDRMSFSGKTVLDHLMKQQRLGQKSGSGFYSYQYTASGQYKKTVDQAVDTLLYSKAKKTTCSDGSIIQRMMIPLCVETARCLEEGIVHAVSEADFSLIIGVGFPAFMGGLFKYLDHYTLQQFNQDAQQYTALGLLYQPTDRMKAMAENNETYYV